MLSFKLELSDKTTVLLPSPVSIVYNSEFSVPADDIMICIPYFKNLDGADYIFAFDEDRLLFKGIVDEIITVKNSGGFFTNISARSMAGILLDNEAEPNIYFNVSAEVIFDKYLRQYGFDYFCGDSSPLYGYFKIDKGFSEWNVFENFCKFKYGKIPRITSSGKAVFDNTYDRNYIFSDTSENKYYSIKKDIKKCKVISEIKVKILENSGYNSTIYNDKIRDKVIDTKILRKRFVDTTCENTTINTVDNMIKNSNNKSFEIVVECQSAFMDCVGESACVYDSFIDEYKDLYIHKIKYILDDRGERSVITLRKVD